MAEDIGELNYEQVTYKIEELNKIGDSDMLWGLPTIDEIKYLHRLAWASTPGNGQTILDFTYNEYSRYWSCSNAEERMGETNVLMIRNINDGTITAANKLSVEKYRARLVRDI